MAVVAIGSLALLLSACEYRPDRNANTVTIVDKQTGQPKGPGQPGGLGAGESGNPAICPTEAGLTKCGIPPTNPAPKATGNFRIANFAGSGSRTFAEGPAAKASFINPIGVATGADGSVYVADDGAHRILRISKGEVTTFAGDGTAGLANGAAKSARFNRPRGIAIASDGTMFVADTGNHVIRAITPAGVVSTIVGSGKAGFKSAPGASALLNAPVGIAISADQRSLYVSEFDNHSVRVMSRTGNIVRTLAGNGNRGFKDGAAGQAMFDSPVGIAVSRAGVVYIADAANNRIRKIEKGTVSTLAGQKGEGFKNGAGAEAKFNLPYGLTIDSAGNLFATEFANNSIRRIDPKGAVTALIVPDKQPNDDPSATPATSEGAAQTFTRPAGIVWTEGRFYVADSGNAKIRLVARA